MSEFMAFVVAGVLSGLQTAANPDRPELTQAQIDGLRAKNIFSPFRTKPFPPKTTPGTKGPEATVPSAPARPKPLVLTGIVYHEASKSFQAIVEDKNPAPQKTGDPDLRILQEPTKFLKAGEEVAGFRIESVEKDKAVVIHGETRKELAVGDTLPETSAAAPAPGSTEKVEPKPPADPAVTNSVLDELKKKNKKKDRTYDEP
jgi:hypothetical protein